MSDQKLTNVLTGIGFGFGLAAMVAPAALNKAYGVTASPETTGATRLYGSRTAGLAALAVMSEGEARDNVIKVVAAISAADTIGAVVTGASGAVSARSAAMTALSTLGVTALCVLALKG